MKNIGTSSINKIPGTISPEAQKNLQILIEEFDPEVKYPGPNDLDHWKKIQKEIEIARTPVNEKIVKDYEARVIERESEKLKFLEIIPKNYRESEKIIIYLHGGGYTLHPAKTCLVAGVPVAEYSGKKVVVLDYPLAPHARYTEILQSFANLYDHLLKEGYSEKNIAIYGDSAGGGLAAGGLLMLKDRGFPMPSALVLWSPWSDLLGNGDAYICLRNHDPKLNFENLLSACALAYAPQKEHQNPYISPIYGEYDEAFPPTLIQFGTREIFLSDAVRLYQKMDEQGVEVYLDGHEGMWHAWQKVYQLPEAKRAVEKTCNFFEKYW